MKDGAILVVLLAVFFGTHDVSSFAVSKIWRKGLLLAEKDTSSQSKLNSKNSMEV